MAGCTSVEKKSFNWLEVSSGKWSSSAKIIENKTGKAQTVDLIFRAKREKQVRLDVSAMMGTPVASIVLDNNKIEAVLIRQKKIYVGKSTPVTNSKITTGIKPNIMPNIMKEALGFEFDPHLIFSVLFESTPSDEKWACTEDGDKMKRCVGPKENFIIKWENRKDIKRIVQLDTVDFQFTINFNDFSPDDLLDPKTFVIKKPKSFKVIELN
ncbi:MAG: hypothetical protein SGJ18_06130 [Pseudomonadota bacterium]|nr:hypothetical protein [Pseudomonadota bacterium]